VKKEEPKGFLGKIVERLESDINPLEVPLSQTPQRRENRMHQKKEGSQENRKSDSPFERWALLNQEQKDIVLQRLSDVIKKLISILNLLFQDSDSLTKLLAAKIFFNISHILPKEDIIQFLDPISNLSKSKSFLEVDAYIISIIGLSTFYAACEILDKNIKEKMFNSISF
jgi:hypothetical protein